MKPSPLIVASTAVLLTLSLSACSGTAAEDIENAEAPTPQTVAEACAMIVEPISQSTSVVLESAGTVSDPQGMVNIWDDLAVSFSDASSGIFNDEVKAATVSVHDAIAETRDVIEKAFVQKDVAAATDMTRVMQKMQDSLTDLTTLCS